mmetsp:Transcript_21110/g.49409  ORF Transcript_21110/g.49409 Transcript_21110/m.49409 type:complete len:267 (+) Transcript_21110:425-1225(+)
MVMIRRLERGLPAPHVCWLERVPFLRNDKRFVVPDHNFMQLLTEEVEHVQVLGFSNSDIVKPRQVGLRGTVQSQTRFLDKELQRDCHLHGDNAVDRDASLHRWARQLVWRLPVLIAVHGPLDDEAATLDAFFALSSDLVHVAHQLHVSHRLAPRLHRCLRVLLPSALQLAFASSNLVWLDEGELGQGTKCKRHQHSSRDSDHSRSLRKCDWNHKILPEAREAELPLDRSISPNSSSHTHSRVVRESSLDPSFGSEVFTVASRPSEH